jgi:hypothetical protein
VRRGKAAPKAIRSLIEVFGRHANAPNLTRRSRLWRGVTSGDETGGAYLAREGAPAMLGIYDGVGERGKM